MATQGKRFTICVDLIIGLDYDDNREYAHIRGLIENKLFGNPATNSAFMELVANAINSPHEKLRKVQVH